MSDIVGIEDATEQEVRDGLDVAEELSALLEKDDWGELDPHWFLCMAEGEGAMLAEDEEARQGDYGSGREFEEYEYRTVARRLVVELARRLRSRWNKGGQQ